MVAGITVWRKPRFLFRSAHTAAWGAAGMYLAALPISILLSGLGAVRHDFLLK